MIYTGEMMSEAVLALPNPEEKLRTVAVFKGSKADLDNIGYPIRDTLSPDRYVMGSSRSGNRRIVLELDRASWMKSYWLWLEIDGRHIHGINRNFFSPPADYTGTFEGNEEGGYLCVRGLPNVSGIQGADHQRDTSDSVLMEAHYMLEDKGRIFSQITGKLLMAEGGGTPEEIRARMFFLGVPNFDLQNVPQVIDYQKTRDAMVDWFGSLIADPVQFDKASLDVLPLLNQSAVAY